MSHYGLQSTEGRRVAITISVLLLVSIASVILRLVTRRMQSITLVFDDYVIVAALVFVVAGTAVAIEMITNGGVGLQLGAVALADMEYMFKLLLVLQILYAIGLLLVKASILGLYWRLFGVKVGFRRAIYVVGAVVLAWAISSILETFLLCTPFEYNWNPAVEGGRCANRNAAFIATGVLNLVTDLMVLSLPLSHIWALQLPLGQRLGLLVIFSLGMLISAISMIRLVSLTQLDFANPTYTATMPLLWSVVETQLAVITANLPFMRQIFAVLLPQGWLGSNKPGYDQRTHPYQRNMSSKNTNNDYQMTVMYQGPKPGAVVSMAQSKVSDGGQGDDSDTELAARGVLPDGIYVRKDFHQAMRHEDDE